MYKKERLCEFVMCVCVCAYDNASSARQTWNQFNQPIIMATVPISYSVLQACYFKKVKQSCFLM